jgi:hypothetical protein
MITGIRRQPRLFGGERLRPILAFVALAGLVYIVWVSTHAYSEARRYFARATYLAECQPPAPAVAGQCAELAAQRPHTPAGIDITDRAVLLAEGSAVQSTATGILTMAGLWLATFGVLLAAFRPRPPAAG